MCDRRCENQSSDHDYFMYNYYNYINDKLLLLLLLANIIVFYKHKNYDNHHNYSKQL